MQNFKTILMGSVAIACIGASSGTAQAQSVAFGAGATFPQIAYRQLMDCMYNQAQGGPAPLPGPLAKAASCASFNGSTFGGAILYAPTGSGNGKTVLRTNSKASIGTPSNSVPYTDQTLGINAVADYDGVQFVGSDDVINAADITAWNAAGNPATFGNIVQIPAMAGAVGLGFNGKDGNGNTLNIANATPAGGSSGLNLSRKAMCGIVSGHITKWDNPILTALNNGVALGTGNITLVHRRDGSGTTYLFSNALVEQCRYQFGPNNEVDATVVSYAFPWTDRAGSCAQPLLPVGANQLNWPDQFSTDQCGNAVANPGGGTFANASGTGSLITLVSTTNGAIGYASTDFWLPVRVGGMATANLESQWDITVGTGQFYPPTTAATEAAIASVTPKFANAATRANPLAWSLQGVVPNPALPGSYPIVGFTWINMYQCYQPHANGNNGYVWFMTFLNYLYGSPNATQIIHDNGFGAVPGQWIQESYALLTDPNFGPQMSGAGGCVGKVGAY
jgi:phosphate transport system substrate-binding protein